MGRRRRSLLFGLTLSGLWVALAAPAVAEPITWPTRPSDLRQLSFIRPGLIAQVLVDEGDTVENGSILVVQDDRVEQKELETLNMLAADRTRVEFAEAAWEKAKVDLQQAEEAAALGGVTPLELRDAQLELKLKDASLRIAELEHRQTVADRDRMKIRLEQMRIVSPVSGRVERVFLREGESADALEKVLVIVQTDPLWVEVPVPVALARRLQLGQRATVRYADDMDNPAAAAISATIVHKASVADAASSTLTVRVEFGNVDHRPAGETVQVSFDVAAPAAETE